MNLSSDSEMDEIRTIYQYSAAQDEWLRMHGLRRGSLVLVARRIVPPDYLGYRWSDKYMTVGFVREIRRIESRGIVLNIDRAQLQPNGIVSCIYPFFCLEPIRTRKQDT